MLAVERRLGEYRHYAHARLQTSQFLDDVNMHKRIHSALGYLTPVEFALQWEQAEVSAEVIPEESGHTVSNSWESPQLEQSSQHQCSESFSDLQSTRRLIDAEITASLLAERPGLRKTVGSGSDDDAIFDLQQRVEAVAYSRCSSSSLNRDADIAVRVIHARQPWYTRPGTDYAACLQRARITLRVRTALREPVA